MIKVIIADDHQMFCDGIRSILEQENGIELIGCASNGIELISMLEKRSADIILMDINMEKMDGIEATQKILGQFPDIRIIILSMYNRKEFITEIIKTGAHGYILKNTGREELLDAIKTVATGNDYFSDDIKNTLLQSYRSENMVQEIILTPREEDVLKLICKEFTTAEIAEKLFISSNTVESHRKNLLSKTGSRNSIGLIKFAFENNLIDASDK